VADENQPRLKQAPQRAGQLINRAIHEARELVDREVAITDDRSFQEWTHDCERWDARTKMALRSVFEGPWPDEFEEAATGSVYRVVNQTDGETIQYRIEALEGAINTLRSFEERLEYIEPAPASATDVAPAGSGVFLVHGRDHGLREAVGRFLGLLGLEVVILDERANQGRTLIEKFERNALDVGFAVVLLTADDRASGPDEDVVPNEPTRARQNVILELGYFMGKLGRDRVVALVAPGVEQPSDIHGLVYLPVAGDAWHLPLARELRAAGLAVDWDQL
jgi:predicted nucleotide-binding protein